MPDRFSRVNNINLVVNGTKVGEGFRLHDDELNVIIGYLNTLDLDHTATQNDLDSLESAFAADYKSPTAPTNPVLNQRWLDTSTNPAAMKYCSAVSPVTWITAFYVKTNGGMVLSGGVTKFSMGTDASKVPSAAGVVYLASDTRILYMDTGTAFVPIGGLIRSATAPANPVEGMEWLDTTTYTRKIYLSGAWVPLYATYAP